MKKEVSNSPHRHTRQFTRLNSVEGSWVGSSWVGGSWVGGSRMGGSWVDGSQVGGSWDLRTPKLQCGTPNMGQSGLAGEGAQGMAVPWVPGDT